MPTRYHHDILGRNNGSHRSGQGRSLAGKYRTRTQPSPCLGGTVSPPWGCHGHHTWIGCLPAQLLLQSRLPGAERRQERRRAPRAAALYSVTLSRDPPLCTRQCSVSTFIRSVPVELRGRVRWCALPRRHGLWGGACGGAVDVREGLIGPVRTRTRTLGPLWRFAYGVGRNWKARFA